MSSVGSLLHIYITFALALYFYCSRVCACAARCLEEKQKKMDHNGRVATKARAVNHDHGWNKIHTSIVRYSGHPQWHAYRWEQFRSRLRRFRDSYPMPSTVRPPQTHRERALLSRQVSLIRFGAIIARASRGRCASPHHHPPWRSGRARRRTTRTTTSRCRSRPRMACRA